MPVNEQLSGSTTPAKSLSTGKVFPTHSLDSILRPQSVAIIGASDNRARIGGRPIRYLLEAGYQGLIFPVNPKHRLIQGLKAFQSINDISEPVDLAIVAVPAPHVLKVVRDCSARGVKGVIIFSAGFAETGSDGRKVQQQLADVAQTTGMRIVGPNCLGVYNSDIGFYGTFTTTLEDGFPIAGRVGLASQSGAYGSHLSLLAKHRRIGVRYWITTGNESDISVPESIAWLADQPDVDVIVAYAEGITDRDMLLLALERARASKKPVVIMKVGTSDVGAEAVASHTASLAGADVVYDAAFRQFGAYRAYSTEEMLDVAYACTFGIYPSSPRVALLSISGGVGVQMADSAIDAGLDVAPLSATAQSRLKAALPYASPRNPVDITAQAFNNLDLIGDNLQLILSDGRFDSIVAFFTYVAAAEGMVDSIRETLSKAKKAHPGTLIILSIVGSTSIVRQYEDAGCPVFEDPTRAVRSVAALYRFSEFFSRKPTQPPDTELLTYKRISIPKRFSEFKAKRLLANAGISIVNETLATTPDEAARQAATIGFPVAMKVSSPDVVHKTEIGGVALNIASAGAVKKTFRILSQRLQSNKPDAHFEGILLSPMVTDGIETILGIRRDPTFGPVVMFGLGGVFVETLNEVSFRVAPFDKREAELMIGETKGGTLLTKNRTGQRYDIDALITALVNLSLFATAYGEQLESAEINPFTVLPEGKGAIALDAVVIPRQN